MSERHRKQRAPRLKRKRVAHIPGYLPEAEMAEQLGVAVRTLRKWRQQGQGPAYTKFGKQVQYATVLATHGCAPKKCSRFALPEIGTPRVAYPRRLTFEMHHQTPIQRSIHSGTPI
jgi:hypothetical protein